MLIILAETLHGMIREIFIAPVIGDLYEKEEFPYAIVAKMGEMGLFGLPVGEEYGGMGGDYFALCLALEELARVDSSVAITLEAGRYVLPGDEDAWDQEAGLLDPEYQLAMFRWREEHILSGAARRPLAVRTAVR